MSDRGAVKKSSKVSDGAPAIPLPTAVWVTVARFTLDDVGTQSLGWSVLGGELYGKLPATLPKGIQAHWVRKAGTANEDPTKRTGLVIGDSRDWAGIVPASIEYLTASDFPLELRVKQTGSVWSLSTAIAAIVAPATYAASRLTIGSDD